MERKIIAVDLDGTITEYDGWQGEKHIGEPIDGCVEVLKKLKKSHVIIIHTCRNNLEYVKKYLDKHQIPYDYINENPYQPDSAGNDKIFAHHYIDDRAVKFDGDWKEVEDKIMEA